MKATTITLLEMKKCLYEAIRTKWVEVTGTCSCHEYAYDYILSDNPQIVVRVFTSIQKQTDVSRRKGSDAIRICAINITGREGWIKTTKVLRVEGWKRNLIRAINNCTKSARLRMNKIQPARNTKTMQTFSSFTERTELLVKKIVPLIFAKENEQQELFSLKSVTKATELRDFIWTKTDDGFCTDVSDLEANRENWPRNKCHCGGYYQKKNLIKVIKTDDEDYETRGWEFKCPNCHATLTIFND
jgi:hypothetical protein